LAEEAENWFEIGNEDRLNPFMLRVWPFKSGLADRVPAVTHVDRTGRVQTITHHANPSLHAVITAFYERTGIPMLLNTSFNSREEPIVETPEDAVWCMLGWGLDFCSLEDTIIVKGFNPYLISRRPCYAQNVQLACR
jgi:carbamoyltransferase